MREWDLKRLRALNITSSTPRTTSNVLFEGGQVISPPQASSPFGDKFYAANDPDIISRYTKKPLPSTPTLKPFASPESTSVLVSSKLNIETTSTGSATDRLRLTCHHGSGPSEMHEIMTTLDFIPPGPSQLEMYTKDAQRYEKIAVGRKTCLGNKRKNKSGARTTAMFCNGKTKTKYALKGPRGEKDKGDK